MNSVGLIGWNGKFNVGDDAMTSVMVNYLLQEKGYKKFELLADEQALATYTNADVEISGFPFYKFAEKIPYFFVFFKNYISPVFFSKNKAMLLIGGGSIFHHKKLSEFYSRMANNVRKKNPDAIIGAIGISIGPFKNEAQQIAAELCLKDMDFVVVRDQRSFELGLKFGLKNLKLASDLALLLPELNKKKFASKTGNDKYIGISLRSAHFDEKKKVWIADLLRKILTENPDYKLKLFNFCVLNGQSDMVENNKLITQLGTDFIKRIVIVDYSKNPFTFYEEIHSCELMFCMRLHAAIISYVVNTKFVVLSYHQKCVDFADEVGLPERYRLDETKSLSDNYDELNFLIKKEDIIFQKPQQDILKNAKGHFDFIPSNK